MRRRGAPRAPRRPPRALLFAPFSSKNGKKARRAEDSREREFDRDALGHSRGRRNGNPRIAFFSSSRQRLPSGAACPPPVFPPSLSPQAPPLSLSPLSPPNSIRVHAERRVGRGRGMCSSSDGEDGARMGGGGGRRRRGNRGKHGRRRRRLRSVSRGAQPALRRARGPRQSADASGRGRSCAKHGGLRLTGGKRVRGGEKGGRSVRVEDGK